MTTITADTTLTAVFTPLTFDYNAGGGIETRSPIGDVLAILLASLALILRPKKRGAR